MNLLDVIHEISPKRSPFIVRGWRQITYRGQSMRNRRRALARAKVPRARLHYWDARKER